MLDVGCGAGELLARIKARHGARTEGIEPARSWAPAARDRVDILHEARFDEVTLELGGYDLVCCLASSHAIGGWEPRSAASPALARPTAGSGSSARASGGARRAPATSGARRRDPGRAADGLAGLEAGARGAGWEVLDAAVASDADWARYEETLIANGEAELAQGDDPGCARGSRPRGRAGRARAGRTRWASRCSPCGGPAARASRSLTIRAVAPQIRWSPTW